MSFQQLLTKIDPKRLFLIDSLGALLSAIMLGFVLARFENTFGMPQKVLYLLSIIAFIFSVYSLLCFLGKIENWRPYMQVIAVTNLLYCCLTIVFTIYMYQRLTVAGLVYFVLEIIVVTILAITELKTALNLIYKKIQMN